MYFITEWIEIFRWIWFTCTQSNRLIMLFSLILFMKAYPAPLSVIVKPKASSFFSTSISFGRPWMEVNKEIYDNNMEINYIDELCALLWISNYNFITDCDWNWGNKNYWKLHLIVSHSLFPVFNHWVKMPCNALSCQKCHIITFSVCENKVFQANLSSK